MATQTNLAMLKKLQIGINSKFPEERLTYNTTQFYSNKEKRMITMYVIKKTITDEQSQKNQYIKLFSTASQLQVVMFLRDYWYKLNGWELPTDNEVWNEIRDKIEIFNDWDAFRNDEDWSEQHGQYWNN